MSGFSQFGKLGRLRFESAFLLYEALAFYRDQVGFDVRRDLPMGPLGRWIEMAPPGAESSIVLYPKAMMPDWDKRIPSIVFACDDTVATCAELVKRGVA